MTTEEQQLLDATPACPTCGHLMILHGEYQEYPEGGCCRVPGCDECRAYYDSAYYPSEIYVAIRTYVLEKVATEIRTRRESDMRKHIEESVDQ